MLGEADGQGETSASLWSLTAPLLICLSMFCPVAGFAGDIRVVGEAGLSAILRGIGISALSASGLRVRVQLGLGRRRANTN